METCAVLREAGGISLYYSGYPALDPEGQRGPAALGRLRSADGLTFDRNPDAPILEPIPGDRDGDDIFSAVMLARDDQLDAVYVGWCVDGYHDGLACTHGPAIQLLGATRNPGGVWTRNPEPVLGPRPDPAWLQEGVAEPDLLRGPDGQYYLFLSGALGDDEPRVTGLAVGPSPFGPFCGDGDAGPGEECDDGADNADTNSCKADCTNNVCGDGQVGPGEGCDDGNEVDDDDCGNDCAPRLRRRRGRPDRAVRRRQQGQHRRAPSPAPTRSAATASSRTATTRSATTASTTPTTPPAPPSAPDNVCGDGADVYNTGDGAEECDNGADNGPGKTCNATASSTSAATATRPRRGVRRRQQHGRRRLLRHLRARGAAATSPRPRRGLRRRQERRQRRRLHRRLPAPPCAATACSSRARARPATTAAENSDTAACTAAARSPCAATASSSPRRRAVRRRPRQRPRQGLQRQTARRTSAATATSAPARPATTAT
jgi:hypothetical protein